MMIKNRWYSYTSLTKQLIVLVGLCVLIANSVYAKINLIKKAHTDSIYLSDIITELQKKWPNNHSINLVFHGHSVPSGYQKTPIVNTFDAYPLLSLKLITEKYPYAVVNVMRTAIGGENSEQGAKRFKKEVLIYKPDVLFIDYALNDRKMGLAKAKTAWEKMIKMSLNNNINLVLMTPTPDLNEDIKDANTLLAQHSNQIIALGKKYHIPVIDSYNTFRKMAIGGIDLNPFMAQKNHVNDKGHLIVAKLIMDLFK